MIIRHQSFIRGAKLMNRNGREYEVLADTRNDRTLVCSFGCKYPFVCVACSINQYDDGRIDWEHSELIRLLGMAGRPPELCRRSLPFVTICNFLPLF